MKHVKILGVLTAVVTALMAFAASAGATTITNGSTEAAGTLSATNESNISLKSQGLEITCQHSGLEGTIVEQGTGKTAVATLGVLTFSECSQHIKVVIKGKLEVHWTSGSNGLVTGCCTTLEVDYTTIFGTVHCNYFASSPIQLGTVTGAANHTTGTGTLDVNTAGVPVEEGGSSGLCGAFASLTGNYKVNAPQGMTVDQN